MKALPVEEFGPYRLEELIGRGGMGEVFRAYDTRRDRTVALKRLGADLATDDYFQARFRQESRLVAQLREPHVIPIHDYGEIDGRLYIDMRLVEGTSLAALISETGGLPPDRAVALVGQVASALDAAHAAGLLHRDVKPSNVLVSGDTDFAYLVDFGLARGVMDATVTGGRGVLGTPEYMAPERFGVEPQDGRVDVYSLACLLWVALTGSTPFRAGNLLGLMYAHIHAERPMLSIVRPDLAVLDDVLARGMAREPADRFATCGEFAGAARTALRADRTSPVRRLIEPSRAEPVEAPTTAIGSAAATPGPGAARPRPATEPQPPPPSEPQPSPPSEPRPSPPPSPPPEPQPSPPPEPRPPVGWTPPRPAAVDGPPAPASPVRRRWLPVAVSGFVAVLVAAGIAVVLLLPRGVPSPSDQPQPTTRAPSPTLDTVVGQIQVGGAPDGIALAPDGRRAYITDRGALSVIDLATATVTSSVDLNSPVGVAVSPDGTRVYVVDSAADTVSVVDPTTVPARLVDTITVGDEPVRIAAAPDGNLLYVTDRSAGTVSVVDLARRTVVAAVPIGANPDHPTLDAAAARLYVTRPRSDAVSVLDTRTNTAVPDPPKIAGEPFTIAVDSAGGRGYVTNSAAGTVTVFDTADNSVVGTIPVGRTPIRVVLTPDATRLYVTNVGGSSVSVVDIATSQVRAIPMAGQPSDAVISPDGTRLYVTGLGSGVIYVVDVDAGG